jgi:hypothetical protein
MSDDGCADSTRADIEAPLKAEIERLRAALTRIAEVSLSDPEASAYEFGHIAERALENNPAEQIRERSWERGCFRFHIGGCFPMDVNECARRTYHAMGCVDNPIPCSDACGCFAALVAPFNEIERLRAALLDVCDRWDENEWCGDNVGYVIPMVRAVERARAILTEQTAIKEYR